MPFFSSTNETASRLIEPNIYSKMNDIRIHFYEGGLLLVFYVLFFTAQDSNLIFFGTFYRLGFFSHPSLIVSNFELGLNISISSIVMVLVSLIQLRDFSVTVALVCFLSLSITLFNIRIYFPNLIVFWIFIAPVRFFKWIFVYIFGYFFVGFFIIEANWNLLMIMTIWLKVHKFWNNTFV